MTSSTDTSGFTRLATPELRSGDLTRLGGVGVLGDPVLEHTLASLVEEARRAARSQGYAVGWAEGRREASAQAAQHAADARARRDDEHAAWQARQQSALNALAAAARDLADATHRVQAVLDERATELARELTETMVGHELAAADAGGRTAADVAARVLATTPGDSPCVVRVHPDAVAAVSAAVGSSVSGPDAAGVRVLPDPRLDPADAVVEVDEQVVDLRISTALERVRAVLS